MSDEEMRSDLERPHPGIPPEKEAGLDKVRPENWLAVLEDLFEAPDRSKEQYEAGAKLQRLITGLIHKVLAKEDGWYIQEGDQVDIYSHTVQRVLEKYKIKDIRKNPGEFVRFVETIVKNKMIDIFRKRQKNLLVLMDDEGLGDIQLKQGDAESTEEQAIRRVEVRMALETLSEKERESVVAVDIDGEKYRDAATRLGFPIRTLRVHLTSGREKLRRILEKE